MSKSTIQEAQQAKSALIETIEEALNTFTIKTGLSVDSIDMRHIRKVVPDEAGYFVYDTITVDLYEVKVSVSL